MFLASSVKPHFIHLELKCYLLAFVVAPEHVCVVLVAVGGTPQQAALKPVTNLC